MTYEDLVASACKWILTEGSCAAVFKEFADGEETGPRPDVIGIGSFGRSILLKAYVSRADFEKDVQNKAWQTPGQEMGRYRFLCVPFNEIQETEVPANWGLIYVNEAKQATCVLNPYNPNNGDFWRNGFEDHLLYDLLTQNDQLYASCRRLRYKAVIHFQ
ncbi:hypothetical protein [Rufibacter roseolus]|uniref:hypothetical protein n=1 Tax=Rufibacter roseolus TaxID=2817375 RepID=UPI001B306A37|nr:hypothetical protein [Rufibacter roseolus]